MRKTIIIMAYISLSVLIGSTGYMLFMVYSIITWGFYSILIEPNIFIIYLEFILLSFTLLSLPILIPFIIKKIDINTLKKNDSKW